MKSPAMGWPRLLPRISPTAAASGSSIDRRTHPLGDRARRRLSLRARTGLRRVRRGGTSADSGEPRNSSSPALLLHGAATARVSRRSPGDLSAAPRHADSTGTEARSHQTDERRQRVAASAIRISAPRADTSRPGSAIAATQHQAPGSRAARRGRSVLKLRKRIVLTISSAGTSTIAMREQRLRRGRAVLTGYAEDGRRRHGRRPPDSACPTK